MMRICEVCGASFEAKRANMCSPRCRKRSSRGTYVTRPHSVTTGTKPVTLSRTSVTLDPNSSNLGVNSLVTATLVELETAGVADTMLGQMALRIADQMSGRESAAGMASLSKELSRVMAEALRAAVSAQADPVDELQARREAKLAAG